MDSSQSQSHNGINAKREQREVVVVVGGGQYATVWNVRDPQMHDTTPPKNPKNKKKKLLQNKLNSNFVKIKIK